MIKNKNGEEMLLPETLKIIIAVICIVILIYLGVSLYGIFSQKTKLEQANQGLDEIILTLDRLENNENGTYLVLGPKDWFLTSWSKSDDNRPEKCEGSCICICNFVESKKISLDNIKVNYIEEEQRKSNCDKEGVCRAVGAQYAITKNIVENINKIEYKYIGLNEIPLTVNVTKNNVVINLFR